MSHQPSDLQKNGRSFPLPAQRITERSWSIRSGSKGPWSSMYLGWSLSIRSLERQSISQGQRRAEATSHESNIQANLRIIHSPESMAHAASHTSLEKAPSPPVGRNLMEGSCDPILVPWGDSIRGRKEGLSELRRHDRRIDQLFVILRWTRCLFSSSP